MYYHLLYLDDLLLFNPRPPCSKILGHLLAAGPGFCNQFPKIQYCSSHMVQFLGFKIDSVQWPFASTISNNKKGTSEALEGRTHFFVYPRQGSWASLPPLFRKFSHAHSTNMPCSASRPAISYDQEVPLDLETRSKLFW